MAASDQLTVADLKNRKTDEANHNARPLEQILSEFRAARERLLKRVDELDASLFARAIPHPRLKTPMRLVDHLYFVAEHDDHHLARIWNSSTPPGLYLTGMESERAATERKWPQLNL